MNDTGVNGISIKHPISTSTRTTISGVLVGDASTGRVRAATNAEIVTEAELTAGLATKANAVHTHVISDVTNLQSSIDAKLNANDSSVTNARTPLPHTHQTSEIVGLDALLTNFRPVVLTQPLAVSGNVGQSLSLSCLGGILPNTHLNLTYQWQLSTDAGVSYSDITGATSATIPFNPALFGQNGLYRCRLTNAFGNENTDAVALTVAVNIASLFGANDRGLAWDLDQIGTLWQNSTATTAVTAYGDPVGRVDDVSGKGNNLIQTNSSRRPTYARRPKSGVRQLIANSGWVGAVSGSPGTAPTGWNSWSANTGTVTYDSGQQSLTMVCDNQRFFLIPSGFTFAINTTYTWSFVVDLLQPTQLTQIINFSGPSGSSAAVFRANGVVTTALQFVPAGTGIVIEGTLTTGASSSAGVVRMGIGTSSTTTGTGTFYRPQLEIGSARTNYQLSGISIFDVTETGQPDINYLWFDGIDDCLKSATAIDFSNSDEMTVCVGQRKLSDASQRTIIGMGAGIDTADGTIQLTAPNGASTSYAMRSRGTSIATAETTAFAQPDVCVLTGQANISDDLCTLRRNSVQVATSSTDQGSGNFANAVLHVGSRAESSLFFQGHLNSGFIVNRILNPLVLADYEKYWVSVKAGVDL